MQAMQIRCKHCQKPFAMGKEEVQAALELIRDEDLSYYNASCPHCRKNNQVSKDELARFSPDFGKAAEAK
jgi:phage FluMu protein Com